MVACGLCMVPPEHPHECRCGPITGRISWNGNGESAGRNSGRCVSDLQNIRRDADSKCRDSSNRLPLLRIPVNPPYLSHPDPVFNEFGLPDKPYYMTQDVCKVLKVLPDAFRQRIYRGYYPEFEKIGVKRIFTLEQIKELIRITEDLIGQGVFSARPSD